MFAANMNLFLLTLLSLPSPYLAAPHAERRAAVTCTNPWIGSYTALAAYSPMASYCSSLFPVACTSTVPATTTNDFFADRRAVKTTLSPAESSASVQFVSANKLAKTSKSTLCVCYGYQTTAACTSSTTTTTTVKTTKQTTTKSTTTKTTTTKTTTTKTTAPPTTLSLNSGVTYISVCQSKTKNTCQTTSPLAGVGTAYSILYTGCCDNLVCSNNKCVAPSTTSATISSTSTMIPTTTVVVTTSSTVSVTSSSGTTVTPSTSAPATSSTPVVLASPQCGQTAGQFIQAQDYQIIYSASINKWSECATACAGVSGCKSYGISTSNGAYQDVCYVLNSATSQWFSAGGNQNLWAFDPSCSVPATPHDYTQCGTSGNMRQITSDQIPEQESVSSVGECQTYCDKNSQCVSFGVSPSIENPTACYILTIPVIQWLSIQPDQLTFGFDKVCNLAASSSTTAVSATATSSDLVSTSIPSSSLPGTTSIATTTTTGSSGTNCGVFRPFSTPPAITLIPEANQADPYPWCLQYCSQSSSNKALVVSYHACGCYETTVADISFDNSTPRATYWDISCSAVPFTTSSTLIASTTSLPSSSSVPTSIATAYTSVSSIATTTTNPPATSCGMSMTQQTPADMAPLPNTDNPLGFCGQYCQSKEFIALGLINNYCFCYTLTVDALKTYNNKGTGTETYWDIPCADAQQALAAYSSATTTPAKVPLSTQQSTSATQTFAATSTKSIMTSATSTAPVYSSSQKATSVTSPTPTKAPPSTSVIVTTSPATTTKAAAPTSTSTSQAKICGGSGPLVSGVQTGQIQDGGQAIECYDLCRNYSSFSLSGSSSKTCTCYSSSVSGLGLGSGSGARYWDKSCPMAA